MDLKQLLNETGRHNVLKLKKMGIWILYASEIKRKYGSLTNSRFIEKINKCTTELINYSLTWDSTKNGWNFWCEKNNFFNDLYNTKNGWNLKWVEFLE